MFLVIRHILLNLSPESLRMIHMQSVAKLMNYGKEEQTDGVSEKPVQTQKLFKGTLLRVLLGWILLALHFYFGFYFFLRLLQGISYMMWL